ncbi:hypothetical protein SCLCIDRAFT_17353 [Scleroderma citrinum Foug A]|uniref:Thioredoxin domain-containing protein n=1 Tax=Scleroderma citrinum Foug A TaxID=1036808 RepID=A0A0C3DH96_9AGAM|nr:hypothetical protein SCLCIDRAFT_17353 [Scleroderma citrinum Foug A]
MPSLRLGSTAPDFEAQTTTGPIKFHEFIGDSWVILSSHPGVFTPVCTTEFGEVARRASEFSNRNVEVIGISVNSLEDHYKWIQDINDYGSKVGPTDVRFPIDATNRNAKGLPFAIRSVFVIDPKKVIRLTISYPASTGRNIDEILRLLGDKYCVTTPVNWKKGEDVIVHSTVSTEHAKELFKDVTVHKRDALKGMKRTFLQ